MNGACRWITGFLCGAWLVNFCPAEPFLAPGDLFLRHDLRWLADGEGFEAPSQTWPLSWNGIDAEVEEARGDGPSRARLAERLNFEREPGWRPARTWLGMRSGGSAARSFGREPRGRFDAGVELAWMGDRYAGKLAVGRSWSAEADFRGRKDEGLRFDGSYFAARLGNWATGFGQVDRWWGPGWDGALLLSTNARPVPAVFVERRTPEAFENKWLGWLGPWTATSFLGRMEKERATPRPYLWGMRVEFAPRIVPGLEIGLSRVIQLGGEGRPSGWKTFADAFLGQDNVGANTGKDPAAEPGNQLAGVDFRWRLPKGMPAALYGQVAGEDEDHFLPNALLYGLGAETWGETEKGSWRLFAEYANTGTWWWTGDPRRENITYNHHLYPDGYRHYGRSLGHWADSDSRTTSAGWLWAGNSGRGWGIVARTGELNLDGSGVSAISNGTRTDLREVEVLHRRGLSGLEAELVVQVGWEDWETSTGVGSESGLTGFLSIERVF